MAERRLPIATLVVIAINLAVAYGSLLHPEFPEQYGFRADAPSALNALACLFVHANIVHLLGNMVFLAAVGATVEQLSGTLRFVLVYFASGLAGVLAHWVLGPRGEDVVPLVGASGCIAGCAAYYSIRYLKLRVPMAPKVGMSVAAVTLLWLVLQVLGAFVHLGDQKPVTAFWAHIGGFFMGLMLSVMFRAPDIGQLQADRAQLQEMSERSPGAVMAAAEQQLKERPDDVPALMELALVQQRMGEREEEAATLFKVLDLTPEAKQGPILERLCALGKVGSIPAHRRMSLAERHKADEPSVSVALLRSVLKDPSAENMIPDVLLALASLEMESSPARAKERLAQLSQKYPLHPATEIARAKGLL